MWAQGITSLFDQRPLDAVYREYCIKDVLDLPFIQRRMMEVGEVDVGLARWIS